MPKGRVCPSGFKAASLLLVIGLIAGCGEGGMHSTASSALSKPFVVRSSGMTESGQIPDGLRCSENSVWLPLEWLNPPNATSEVVVVIKRVRTSHPNKVQVAEVVHDEWLIAGIGPGTQRLNYGPIPTGAYMLPFSRGSSCPTSGKKTKMIFTVFAMPGLHTRQAYERYGPSASGQLDKIALARASLAAMYVP